MSVRLTISNSVVRDLIHETFPHKCSPSQGSELLIVQPFTLEEVAIIQSKTNDSSVRIRIATECQVANQKFVHAFDDSELLEWINTALRSATLFPLLIPARPDSVVDSLHDFCERSPHDFATRFLLRLEQVVKVGLQHWREHSTETLLTLLDAIDAFDLSSLAFLLYDIIVTTEDTQKNSVLTTEAVKVLAGLERDSIKPQLLYLMEHPQHVAPCYEALVFIDPGLAKRCFASAASTASKAGEDATDAVCRVVAQSLDPDRVSVLADLCRELVRRASADSEEILSALSRALGELRNHYVVTPTRTYTAIEGLQESPSALMIEDLKYPGSKERIELPEDMLRLMLTVIHNDYDAACARSSTSVTRDELAALVSCT